MPVWSLWTDSYIYVHTYRYHLHLPWQWCLQVIQKPTGQTHAHESRSLWSGNGWVIPGLSSFDLLLCLIMEWSHHKFAQIHVRFTGSSRKILLQIEEHWEKRFFSACSVSSCLGWCQLGMIPEATWLFIITRKHWELQVWEFHGLML
jgi:hypothetical protein